MCSPLITAGTPAVSAERNPLPATPSSETRIVSDGNHNAFSALTRWRGDYWLAFRRGTGHVARDGDLIVLRSSDTANWTNVIKFDVSGDDRDAQFLVADQKLLLYINSLNSGSFDVFVSATEDGQVWTDPQRIYQPGFILWKPIEFNGQFYAGAHRPASIDRRESHLIRSSDGIHWEKVSTIRSGHGESETSLLFGADGKLTAFLRSQVTVGGSILVASPPYTSWDETPAGVHLSGHTVHRFDGVTYLVTRHLAYDPPVDPAARRDVLAGRKLDQGTIVYTYEADRLEPYCLLGPLDGNHDSSYAVVVRAQGEMLIVYHRAAHEFFGEFRARDAADIFLARVPLK